MIFLCVLMMKHLFVWGSEEMVLYSESDLMVYNPKNKLKESLKEELELLVKARPTQVVT